MSNTIDTGSRRRFLKLAGISVVMAPIVGRSLSQSVRAQGLPKLEESDPQAKALMYVHQSEKADQSCKNCALYKGEASSAWGPCQIFPGKDVNANGWCRTWVAKPAG